MRTFQNAQKFNFWKGNKVSDHFQLTRTELIERFKTWLKTKNVTWVEHHMMRDCLKDFLSNELGSIIKNDPNQFSEYDVMEEVLTGIRNDYLTLMQK